MASDQKIAELFVQLEPKDDATVIQAKDYGTALRRLGASPSQADISKRISDQSLDHSATVSLELFKTMSEGLSFEPAESVDELLKQLSSFQDDASGELDLAKLKAALMSTGEAMTAEEVQRSFALLGCGADGATISAAAFAQKATFTDAASLIRTNIEAMNMALGFDVVVVCTSTAHQAAYWQQRLTATRGKVAPADAVVIAVDEDWNKGGAGNGLGTLYAFKKAAAIAKEQHGRDIGAELASGAISMAIYHTAGKGTRLAPLPGGENNNKPGVKLPGSVEVDGVSSAITILECVIKQTGTYASSRKGRLSAFWGDQVFVPSAPCAYTADSHADILAALGPMPSEEEWAAKEMHKYGLIAVNSEGKGAQVEKVDFATATELLSTLGTVEKVGTSLGSFSMSAQLLAALNDEFATELEEKNVALDSDPHFWMPLTLAVDGYCKIMEKKGVDAEESKAHFARIAKVSASLEGPLFGAVPVGNEGYWWDYGQLKLYLQNNLLATHDTEEAAALRRFLGIAQDRTAGSTLGACKVDANSCVLASKVLAGGDIGSSVLTNVRARDVSVSDSILMNVTARSITGKNCIVYNVVDDSAEGLTLEDGDVLVGVILPSGERIRMRSNIKTDGGDAWKEIVHGNARTFEGVYLLNADADVVALEKQFLDEQERVTALLEVKEEPAAAAEAEGEAAEPPAPPAAGSE
ncbi:hypothetical protein N9362_00175 [bacterium]|nr:hypothetical protein [bacterium]